MPVLGVCFYVLKQKDACNVALLTLWRPNRLTIIGDLQVNGWLGTATATQDLWPNMLYRYSASGEIRDLQMVYGEFV